MRIKSIRAIEKPDVVYNLSVEDNENYIANGVVVHNCHGARGVKISDYLKFCMRAEFKIGTTGTLPTSKCDQWTCKSVLGKTLYKITSKELIERGFLTKIIIANIFLQYPMDFILSNQERTFPEEVRMVEEYENRKTILNKILGPSTAFIVAGVIAVIGVILVFMLPSQKKKA